MSTLVLVIGAGQLGRAVATDARRRQLPTEVVTSMPWHLPTAAADATARALTGAMARWNPSRVVLCWCAGGGAVSADKAAMDLETQLLASLLERTRQQSHDTRVPMTISFASSGGAIWSGSRAPTLTESTPPAPAHPYGRAKLEQEGLIRQAVAGSAFVGARLGRIANLYGPALHRRPPRGLIEILVAQSLTRTPTRIYVPLDTMRDYVFSTQAARLLLDDALTDVAAGSCTIDLIASGESRTIIHVAKTLERVLTRRVPLTVGVSPLAARQPRILNFRSERRDLAALNTMPLAAGMRVLVTAALAGSTR